MTRSRAGVAAICLLGLCWAAVMVPPGANQTAQLANVHAFARGSANIDRERRWTGDTAYVDGHFFAAKAPGLALATTPYFLAIDRAGLVPSLPSPAVPFPRAQEQMPRTVLWEVALFGAMLPGLVLLFLVRGVVERLMPGYGTAVAVAVGGASILGILATMFFNHTLSACLAFGAFACLLEGRSVRRHAAAGVLVGLAVSVELPLAIVAVVLAVDAFVGDRSLRRLGAYAGGVVVGLAPLLAFDTWAFGSPLKIAYADAVTVPGASGHAVLGQNSTGFFGIGHPNLQGAVQLLFSAQGLLVLAPIWGLALVGVVQLWRDGRRREAGLVGAIAILFFAYNACYQQLFGGITAGPRFLAAAIPFLALPLAAAWRRLPLTAWALCIAAGIVTWTIVAADPMGPAEDPGTFFRRLEHGGDASAPLSSTVFHWISSGHPRLELAVVLAGVAAAFALAARATPIHVRRRDVLLAVLALVAWRVAYTAGTTLLKIDKQSGGWAGAAAMMLVAVGLAWALYAAARARALPAVPALGLLPLLWTRIDGSTSAVTGLAGAVLAVSALAAVGPARLSWIRRPGADNPG